MGNVQMVSQTQKIIMNAATSSVSVINAGPIGPPGTGGSGSVDESEVLSIMDASLNEGSGIHIDKSVPGEFTITNTGAVGSYDIDDARADISATLVGVPDQIDISPLDASNLINVGLSQTQLDRILALEQAPSLIQFNDSTDATGTPYMNITGAAGHVSAAYNVAYNVAGDLTVTALVYMPAVAPAATFTVAARWGSSTALGQWRFSITPAGQMELTIVTAATMVADTAPTTSLTPLVFNGSPIWVRFSLPIATGLVDFYKGVFDGTNTEPAVWTSFQANRSINTGALNAPTSVPISIGAYNGGASLPFTGKIGRVKVYSGFSVTDTLIADGNASDWTSGSSWTGPLSRVWTLNGTASILGGGANSISSTSTEFELAATVANDGVTLVRGDTLIWSSVGTFINTSGSPVNFTPKYQINGVNLFTFSAISIPSTAVGQVYRWEASLRVQMNDAVGSKQIAVAEFIVYSATTGTNLGSSVMSGPISGGTLGGNRAEGITNFTTIPKLALLNTMAAPALPTVASRATLTQLFLATA